MATVTETETMMTIATTVAVIEKVTGTKTAMKITTVTD